MRQAMEGERQDRKEKESGELQERRRENRVGGNNRFSSHSVLSPIGSQSLRKMSRVYTLLRTSSSDVS